MGKDHEISPLTGKKVKIGSNRTGIKASATAGKPGTKPHPIDWDQVAELCKIFCTQDEIAGFVKLTAETIVARYAMEHEGKTFRDFMKYWRSQGSMSIRRAQFYKATEGDDTKMQIWLGKQYLGQSEKQEIQATVAQVVTHDTLLAQIEKRNSDMINVPIVEAEIDDENTAENTLNRDFGEPAKAP